MSYPLDDAFMKLWYFLFLLFFFNASKSGEETSL